MKQASHIDRRGKNWDLVADGDADKLEAALSEDDGPPEINKSCCRTAIPTWRTWPNGILKGKDQALIVVGAAHLVGKDGVVRVLENRGYKVQQFLGEIGGAGVPRVYFFQLFRNLLIRTISSIGLNGFTM